ncbi:MAG: UDP-3-O-(3-hydroxymyristoyl)glucosamine N-acyltransferase [Bacteroidia bacterium]|nr:UDP-3-O-(3-hydroxymyristoyl)glucosamine N-acyltransferase [Bacteroidia bacterium]
MKFEQALSLRTIAELIGATVHGDENYKATGLNEIHMVEEGDITFTDHPKYYKKSLQSAASVVIINAVPEDTYGKHLLVHSDPFSALNKLISYCKPDLQKPNNGISPTARIGKNVVISPNVTIGDNVEIGDNTILHPNVCIYRDVVIGKNCIVHAGCVIGADAFYFKGRPGYYDKFQTCGRVLIGDDVELGALCTIDRGVTGDTIIGKGCKFDNQIHVGHDTYIGERVLMAAQCAIAGVCHIEDEVILWGQIGVTKEVHIGKGAQVLAKSGVIEDLEAGKRYLGNPTSEAFAKNREWILLRKLPGIVKALEKQGVL